MFDLDIELNEDSSQFDVKMSGEVLAKRVKRQ
jgi:hypothetical protein